MNAAAGKWNIPLLLIHTLFFLLSLSMIVPLILIVMISITDEQALLADGFRLIPEKFSLMAYKLVLESPKMLLNAYGVTIFVTTVGTILSLLVVSSAAYALSRRTYRLRKPTLVYFVITMLFNGGLIPSYILITQYLHLKNTIWVLIVPALASVWNIMIMRTYMLSLPQEIVESAYMDGAGEWRIYAVIILPLSMPSVATLGLLTAFGYWNEWFAGLLYIDNDHQNLVPLQLLLYRIETMANYIGSNLGDAARTLVDESRFPAYGTRFAMAVLATGPMLFIFPFFQKYFVKGLTIGSLKG